MKSITREEVVAILACISITEESIGNNFLTITKKENKEIERVNLSNLWGKVYDVLL